jgi:hypothetical protein
MRTLLFFLCIINLQLFGQLGLFTGDSLLWQQSTYYSTGPSGPGQGPQYHYTYYNFFLNGDSVINNTNYKKLYSSSSTTISIYNPNTLIFNSLILVDSNSVFKGLPGSMSKIIDYNLVVGDSFSFAGYTPKQVLLSIDSIMIGGIYCQRYNFQKNIKWVKGIGDVIYGAHFGTYWFLNPSPYTWMERGSNFRCYAEQNNPIFGGYCNLPIGLEEKDEFEKIEIYPNPSNEGFKCLLNRENEQTRFNFYDLSGKEMEIQSTKENKTNYFINTKHVSNGIYFLIVETEKETIRKKIVVQH